MLDRVIDFIFPQRKARKNEALVNELMQASRGDFSILYRALCQVRRASRDYSIQGHPLSKAAIISAIHRLRLHKTDRGE